MVRSMPVIAVTVSVVHDSYCTSDVCDVTDAVASCRHRSHYRRTRHHKIIST